MIHRCKLCGSEFNSSRSVRSFCSPSCYRKSLVGSKLSEGTKEKMSKAKQGFVPTKLFQPGAMHPRWIENRGSGNPRWKKEYQVWRSAIFSRDVVCTRCGSESKLHAHHRKTIREDSRLAFDPANGELLCSSCHIKEHTIWEAKKVG